YLWSQAASHLVSFRLSTSANVADDILGALREGHRLPNLLQLTLRGIADLEAERLFENLVERYCHGCTLPLLVEWDHEVSDTMYRDARKLDIYF
ncbi:hypothetical protein HDZ31DRAFT_5909, partial [Schizophyllum fasciatum]